MPHLARLNFAQRANIDGSNTDKGGPHRLTRVATGTRRHVLACCRAAYAKSGKVKVIATSSEQGEPTLPDTPTVGETLPGSFTGRTRAFSRLPRFSGSDREVCTPKFRAS